MSVEPWISGNSSGSGCVPVSRRTRGAVIGTRIASGFAYALAPRALGLMGVNSGEFLPAAMLPLILIPLVRLLRHGHELDRRQKVRAAAQSGGVVHAKAVAAQDAPHGILWTGAVEGHPLTLIDEVYKSEAATNTGNKALSMLLAKYERIYADPFESVDIYTKQCSVGVNATQLARMGATLANNGINPATGEQVIKAEDVPYILSSMTMAGLYDGSGGWAWRVGLPAKSGVGGGIVAIVPGKGAIAVFAPPLDEAGNSVKAQEVIDYVSQKLNYNLYSPLSVGWK